MRQGRTVFAALAFWVLAQLAGASALATTTPEDLAECSRRLAIYYAALGGVLVPGAPASLHRIVSPVRMAEDARAIAESITHQVTGDARATDGKRHVIDNPGIGDLNELGYFWASYTRAVNHSLEPFLAAQGLSPRNLRPASTQVFVVHQWEGTLAGANLQAQTAATLATHFAQDPVVLVASQNFPVTDRALVEQARRGGIVYSNEGTVLHRDGAGNEIHRDVDANADTLVFAGGFCGACMARTASNAIQMALAHGRTSLTVRVLPRLTYTSDGGVLEDRFTSPRQTGLQIMAVAGTYLRGPGRWAPVLPDGAADPFVQVGGSRRVTFVEVSAPEGQRRTVTFDFTSP